jgi:AhpC/TSA family
VRPPAEAEIYAPKFPTGMEWLNVAFLRMNTLMGRGAVLVEFWDFARINSLRTMPYLKAWHERYADAGLRVIGVHSPGYSFGRDRDTVARAVERLEVGYPVLLDPALAVWRLYGNKGWPGRYLFDRTGKLDFIHYGEGEYLDTELAIQECVGLRLDPLEPVRPEDAPGVLLQPQTADIALPADRERLTLVRDWTDGEDFVEAADAGAAASFTYSAGEAFAVLSGAGVKPGLYEARSGGLGPPRRERESVGTVEAESPGLRLHGVQFTPAPPAPGDAAS